MLYETRRLCVAVESSLALHIVHPRTRLASRSDGTATADSRQLSSEIATVGSNQQVLRHMRAVASVLSSTCDADLEIRVEAAAEFTSAFNIVHSIS